MGVAGNEAYFYIHTYIWREAVSIYIFEKAQAALSFCSAHLPLCCTVGQSTRVGKVMNSFQQASFATLSESVTRRFSFRVFNSYISSNI